MTKKDFELIAGVMRNFTEIDTYPDLNDTDYISHLFADALTETNPRFDRDRFLTACNSI